MPHVSGFSNQMSPVQTGHQFELIAVVISQANVGNSQLISSLLKVQLVMVPDGFLTEIGGLG